MIYASPNAVHLFTAPDQPATRYRDEHGPRVRWRTMPARRRLGCWNGCGHVHEARNMVVHVYYDETRFFCRRGLCGCRP